LASPSDEASLLLSVASGIKAIQVVDEGRGVERVVEIAMGSRPKGYGGRAEPSIIKAWVELREVGAGREEITVWGEANFPEGDHEAFESIMDVILVGATARGPMGQAAATEGDYPCPHVVPDSRHTFIVCGVVVWRRTIRSKGLMFILSTFIWITCTHNT
jgi:hypothetical protein